MAHVLDFDTARQSVRHAGKVMASEYIDRVAAALVQSRMADGTKDTRGHKLVREFEGDESRRAAINIVAGFFVALLQHRAKLEMEAHGETKHLDAFIYAARTRVAHHWRDNVGKTHNVMTDPPAVAALAQVHALLSEGVFALFRQQVQTKSDFYEPKFWFDVVAGIADADPIGVVGRAANMVLLDHRATFGQAFVFDRQLANGFPPDTEH